MGEAGAKVTAGQLLEQLLAGLDRLDGDRSGLSASVRLEWLRLARRARSRVDGLCAVLAAEAEAAQASEKVAGAPLQTWLGRTEVLSRAEASGVVHQARAVAEHPVVGAAAVDGRVNTAQARAITRLLGGLKASLDAAQLARAEQLLVGWAGELDAAQLERSASRVLAAVAPVEADELLEKRLQAEAEDGWRRRFLRFSHEAGCTRFEGLLPRFEGQAWVALINAHAEGARRTALEARDPLATQPSMEQRRADALISLIRGASKAKPVFGVGGARVIVRLDYEKLVERAAGAGLFGDVVRAERAEAGRAGAAGRGSAGRGGAAGPGGAVGRPGAAGPGGAVDRAGAAERDGSAGRGGAAAWTGAADRTAAAERAGFLGQAGAGVVGGCELSAGELRRLCCEAELIPVVLGGASEVLDVGRASRLVTAPIRTALLARDQGCVFPGCDLPPDACEAHHIVPWWAGGASALSNFVLLCHSHHGLVEPARHGTRDQWDVRLAGDGLPEFLPPRRLSASRTPVRHRRHAPPLPDTG